jgi:hypothetical protein
MRRIPLLLATTAGLAAATVAASTHDGASSRARAAIAAPASRPAAAGPRAAATPTTTPVPAAGLAWSLPAGWRAVGPRLTALASPVQQLAAATFDLRQSRADRDCRPDTARAQLPAHGALVLLLEDREAAASPRALAKLPPRPGRFRLPPAVNAECLGRGRTVSWTEQGRAFQAWVLLGRRAGAMRRRQAEALLNSLTVERIPPPPPPAGWRTTVSGSYDSMRVPPGWSARALPHPKRTRRPRLLFRIATDRVVVRVVEHRRGPASPAFPPARDPLVFDAHRRAGMRFRGFRFSITIHARPGASARDLEWAEISARSLGLSSVGRG